MYYKSNIFHGGNYYWNWFHYLNKNSESNIALGSEVISLCMQLCTTLAALANNCKKFLRIFTSNFFNNYTRKVEQTESRYGFLVSMCLLLLQGEKCTHEYFCQLPFTIMLVYTYVYVCRHIFKLRFRQTIKILSLQFNLQNFHWHKSKAWSQMNF